MGQDDQSPIAQQRSIECENVGSVEIPSWGVVEITGVTNPSAGRVILQVQRPTTASATEVAVCGPLAIAVGKFGVCSLDMPAFALYDTAATPANGEAWGTQANLFTLLKNNTGFTVLGGNTGSGATSRTEVVRALSPASFTFQITADSGGVQTINSGDEIDFAGDGGTWEATPYDVGITTRVTAGKDIESQVNATVMQKAVLTGAQALGNLTVEVKSGTRNELGFEQSTADGISVTGDNTAGTVNHKIVNPIFVITDGTNSQNIDYADTISFLDTTSINLSVAVAAKEVTAAIKNPIFSITDVANTEQLDFREQITFIGGNGLTALVSATDKVTYAIDGTVCQKVILASDTGGTVTPADPSTILISAGTVNALQPKAGTNITFVDNLDGTWTINATGGTWTARADAGADQIVDGDIVDVAGGSALAASSAKAIKTTISEAAGVITVQVDVTTNVALETRTSAVSETNYEGKVTGDTTVPVEDGVANAAEFKAGYGIELDTPAGTGVTRIESHSLWGIAQSDSGDAASFNIKLAANSSGGSPKASTDVCFIFAGKGGNNIRSGEVFPVFRSLDGKFITFHGADDTKGTVKMWDANISPLRGGWVRFTDMDDVFPRGPDAADTLVGDLEAVAEESHNHGAATDTNSTGITIVPHPDHSHPINTTSNVYASGGDLNGPQGQVCTGVQQSTNCGGGVALAHPVVDPAHDHPISADHSNPAFQEVFFIKRTS